MKKIIPALLAALIIAALFPPPAFAAKSADGKWTYTENDDRTATVESYTGNDFPNITIPAEIDGKKVTALAKNIFPYEDADKVESLTILAPIKAIAYSQFEDFNYLQKVVLPKTLISIGAEAFSGTGLRSIALPSSLRDIGEGAFSDCPYLESVQFPESGMSYIGDDMFSECENLTSLYIPGNIKTIRRDAFQDCRRLTRVEIAEGCEVIEEDAFGDCGALTRITLPSTIRRIDDDAIDDAYGLTIYGRSDVAKRYAARERIRYQQASGAAADDKKPGAPANVKAKAGAAQITLTWGAASGASGYEIRYSTNGKTFKTLRNTTGKSYVHKKLKAGAKYYYKIRAYKTVNGKKVYGAYSNAVSATAQFAAPKGLKAEAAGSGSVKLTWGAAAGVTGYAIERSANNKNYRTVKNLGARAYTDSELKPGTYYYRVRGYKTVNGQKVYGAYSKPIRVRTDV